MTRARRCYVTGQVARLLLLLACFGGIAFRAQSQDLTPRAYIIVPVHSNAIVVSYSFETGDILLNPTLPISNTEGTIHIPVVSYSHSFNFFGRSAGIAVGLPYAVGHFKGDVNGVPTKLYRSGLYDVSFRLSVNLKGGPAMDVREYMKWKQKTIIGTSLTVSAPTGQYDPSLLVNLGTNRWAIKPEVGVSRRWNHVVADGYFGMYFFTQNNEYFSHNAEFPGVNTQSQNPLGALEAHLSYDVKPRLWVSLDANYWYGGETSINGEHRDGTLVSNSRVGVTTSVPIHKHQSLKFSYSYGAVVRVGGNYHDVSVGWQYSWLGRPN